MFTPFWEVLEKVGLVVVEGGHFASQYRGIAPVLGSRYTIDLLACCAWLAGVCLSELDRA